MTDNLSVLDPDFESLAVLDQAAPITIPDERVSVLGVSISDLTQVDAMMMMEELICRPVRRSQAIFIVNAHTLNLATEDAEYRQVLNSAYRVFGDGTGVRWAARYRGVRLKDNLVGTDLIPRFFEETAGQGYRYYLLGANEQSIARAAHTARESFPGWEQAGFHHGYVNEQTTPAVIDEINASRADMLLVGMGNPLQERWIARNLNELRVPVCVGVGGLFDHWAGNIKRAPRWVRYLGYEWLQLMLQQPHKWQRYLIGNPKFLLRMVRSAREEQRVVEAIA